MKFNTLAVHAGQEPGYCKLTTDPATGAVIPPISLSTTFAQSAAGVHKGFDYSRSGNPTRLAFEKAVAALEGGKHGIHYAILIPGLAFASGSVTTATVASLLGHGSHMISVNDVYCGTFRYFTKVLSTHGVDVDFVDLAVPSNLKAAIKPNTKASVIITVDGLD